MSLSRNGSNYGLVGDHCNTCVSDQNYVLREEQENAQLRIVPRDLGWCFLRWLSRRRFKSSPIPGVSNEDSNKILSRRFEIR